MFKQLIKDYFTFSFSERRGIIFMLALIVLILVIRMAYPHLIRSTKYDAEQFNSEIDEWLGSAKKQIPNVNKSANHDEVQYPVLTLFDFDPNTISVSEINRLDINEKAKKTWIKYLHKGGRFYKSDDLKKIYGLDSVTFQKLKPYIRFEGENDEKENNPDQFISEDFTTVEVNSATQSELEKLTGIGPVLAQRVIRYRSLLGGFVNVDQLVEVYGIHDSIIGKNTDRLILNKSIIKKIDINNADFKTLSSHPYISAYHANAILSYRKLHGNFTSPDDLTRNHLVPDTILHKVSEYLIFSRQ